MKPQFHTLFSNSSEFGEDRWRVKAEKQGKTEEDESQPLINLGLGIGSGPTFCNTTRRSSDHSDKKDCNFIKDDEDINVDDDDQVMEKEGCRKCSVVMFTEDQIEELKKQLLIFKFIVWGLPVPLQLLLPLWRSFSSSFFNTKSSPFLLYNQKMMDPEPGRCRRTDGKKWRCHQSVIPNEKYCEKHMHRGRNRSRKLVEAFSNSRSPNQINLNRNNNPSSNIRPKLSEYLSQNGPTKFVVSKPSLTNATAKSNENDKRNNEAKTGIVANEGIADDKKSNEAKSGIVANERIAALNLPSGLDFSPKSVLQDDTDMRCTRLESCNINPESESRCKRTDGKKWRCKREVLPNRKYCAQHINRGKVHSQKPFLGPSSASRSEPQSAYESTSSAKFCKTEQGKVELGLDTNLKISLPTTVDLSLSSSTEATESDESTDVSDIIVLSP